MANDTIVTSRTFSLEEIDLLSARKARYNTVVSIVGTSKRTDLRNMSVTSDIADNYDSKKQYAAGDYSFYEGELYRAKKLTGPGEFSASSWEKISVSFSLTSLKKYVDDMLGNVETQLSEL